MNRLRPVAQTASLLCRGLPTRRAVAVRGTLAPPSFRRLAAGDTVRFMEREHLKNFDVSWGHEPRQERGRLVREFVFADSRGRGVRAPRGWFMESSLFFPDLLTGREPNRDAQGFKAFKDLTETIPGSFESVGELRQLPRKQ